MYTLNHARSIKNPHFLKKNLHDIAADTRLYMCELLVWLCVMFQSVFEVKVLYVLMYLHAENAVRP